MKIFKQNKCRNCFYCFIQNTSNEMLENFLCFVTGSRSYTAVFIPGYISVEIGNLEALYASTCTLDFKILIGFTDYMHLDNSMRL